jgi:hypothetical protein
VDPKLYEYKGGQMLLGLDDWHLVITIFIPLLVGLVTKVSASSAVKSITLIVANAINVLAQQAINDAGLVTEASLRTFVTSVVVSVAIYYGAWKPLEVAPKVANLTGDSAPIG